MPIRYRGASVGAATRRTGETDRQVLDRAVEAMHHRKQQRRAARQAGEARGR